MALTGGLNLHVFLATGEIQLFYMLISHLYIYIYIYV
jgi:hypothetical protein